MRRRLSYLNPADDELEINITPMLDVVFIMLIFFIVTASFVKESGIEVNRPAAVTAVVQEKGNILVAVTETGEVWVNRRAVDPRALRAHLERPPAENPPRAGGAAPRRPAAVAGTGRGWGRAGTSRGRQRAGRGGPPRLPDRRRVRD